MTGDETTLIRLSEINHEKDLTIERDGNDFILKSDTLNNLSSYSEVKGKVNELLNSVNAIIKLLYNSQKNVNYANIYQLFEDGNVAVYLESTNSIEHIIKVDKLTEANKHDIIRDCIKLVNSNENIRDVLQLINYNFYSWITWFKIIEILQKDDFKPIKEGGEYFKDVERLNRMANSHKATGVGSRHHKDGITPPKNLMDIF